MSEQKDKARDASEPKLTNAQKDTARRIGMSEKEYATEVAKAIRSGKIQREHIT